MRSNRSMTALAVLAAAGIGFAGQGLADDTDLYGQGTLDTSAEVESTASTVSAEADVGQMVMSRAGDEIGPVTGFTTISSSGDTYAIVDVSEYLNIENRDVLIRTDTLRPGAGDTLLMTQNDTEAEISAAAEEPDFENAAGSTVVDVGHVTRRSDEMGPDPIIDSGANADADADANVDADAAAAAEDAVDVDADAGVGASAAADADDDIGDDIGEAADDVAEGVSEAGESVAEGVEDAVE